MKNNKLVSAIIIVVSICLVCAVALYIEFDLYGKTLFKYNNPLEAYGIPRTFFKNGEIPQDITLDGSTYKYNTDILPLLIVGIDKTSQREMQGVGYCADVQLLAAINRKTAEVKIIAIPRETMTDVPVYSGSRYLDNIEYWGTELSQITLIHGYWEGTPIRDDLTMAGISNLLYGVPVVRFITFDIDAIAPLTEAVGGVEVEIIDNFVEYDPNIAVGDKIKIKGELAERYLRDRQLYGMSGLNLDRMKRQSQFIPEFWKTLKSAALKDPQVIRDVITALRSHMETNLTLQETLYLAFILRNVKIDLQDIKMLPGEIDETYDNIYKDYFADEDSLKRLVLETFYTEIK